MVEILRSNDPVLISFVTALFSDSNIEAFVLDTHTSVLEGSIGAIPRRIMVVDDDANQALRLLREAKIVDDSA
jgi:hypothetical protein